MGAVDLTIVATALPAMQRSLHATVNWAGWTITVYGLCTIIASPIAGRLSDQFGRRRIFLYAAALFTIASLLCGFATNIAVLIALRALQGFGGGALAPASAGLIADHFGKGRDRAIGMFGTIGAVGSITGPLIGGVLVGYLSWRWIFFVNVPFGVLLVFFAATVVPASTSRPTSKTDLRGIALLSSFVFAAILAITNLGNAKSGLDDPWVLVPGLLALVLLYAFDRHTRHAKEPFIPRRLLVGRGFAVMNVENILFGALSFGVASLVPLYAENRYHLHALNAGTLLSARAIGVISVGTLATFGLRRTGYRLPLMVGFTIIAVGTLLMSVEPQWNMSAYAWLSLGAGIMGVGNGMVSPASRNACLEMAPEDVAAITGLRQMFVFIGVIFGVAVFTAVLNRSADPAMTQAHAMWVTAGILLFVMVPLVFRVPEHKGSW
jgi:EmrB/QacA subfamily drug resistance transporter